MRAAAWRSLRRSARWASLNASMACSSADEHAMADICMCRRASSPWCIVKYSPWCISASRSSRSPSSASASRTAGVEGRADCWAGESSWRSTCCPAEKATPSPTRVASLRPQALQWRDPARMRRPRSFMNFPPPRRTPAPTPQRKGWKRPPPQATGRLCRFATDARGSPLRKSETTPRTCLAKSREQYSPNLPPPSAFG